MIEIVFNSLSEMYKKKWENWNVNPSNPTHLISHLKSVPPLTDWLNAFELQQSAQTLNVVVVVVVVVDRSSFYDIIFISFSLFL